METGLARTTDPAESHAAAGAIQGTIEQDRLIVLAALKDLGKGTYREIAKHALRSESHSVERLESLRRRGSDLKKLGYIEQIGRHQGQAEFRLTQEGLEVLTIR